MPDKLNRNKPLVTVIICTYNRLSYLPKVTDFILNQRVDFKIEILFGDDGSTDGTRDFLLKLHQAYPQKVRLFFRDENCGLGKNWALLVQEARGKYIASCDDDDYWHNPDKLQLQVDFLEKNPNYGMVHTEKDLLIESENKLIRNYNASKGFQIRQGYLMQPIFKGEIPICVSSSMIKKSVMDQHVPLELFIKHRFHIQDWPTWMFISKHTKIGYLDVSTVTYRVGHAAISNLPSIDKVTHKVEQDQLMYRLVCEHFPDELQYNEEMYNQYKLGILLNFCYKHGYYGKCKEFIKKFWDGNSNYWKAHFAKTSISFYVLSYLLKIKKYTTKSLSRY